MGGIFSRKKLLIYPRFQLTLILVNSMLLIGVFGITLWQASRVFSKFNDIGQVIRLDPSHAYFRLIELQSSQLYSSLIFSFLLSMILAAGATLMISHRLAGPIYRLREYFKTISSQKKVGSKLNFRHGDYFEDLPEAVNSALDVITRDAKASKL